MSENVRSIMSEEKYDIAIVGGGMVGAVTALLLAKAVPKLSIALLEAHPFEPTGIALEPSFDERSTALSPSSTKIFDQLGLWDELSTYATAIQSIHVSDARHPGQALFDQSDNHDQALGYVVENAALGVLLSRALARSSVQYISPCAIDTVQIKKNYAQLENSNRLIQCSLAIIANGAQSLLRQQLGIGVQEDDYRQQALVANVLSQQSHHGRAYERFTAQGPMALLPLGRDIRSSCSALIWSLPNCAADSIKKLDDDPFLSALQTTFGFRLGFFQKITDRKYYHLTRIIAKEQVRSRAVLIGNAAHFIHPVAGQGFNLSLRDGLYLAEQLRDAHQIGVDIGSIGVLKNYAKLRELDQHATLGLSQAFISLFRSSNYSSLLARTFGFAALETVSPLRNQFIRQLSGRSQREAQPFSGI